jgi:hypothetical protein
MTTIKGERQHGVRRTHAKSGRWRSAPFRFVVASALGLALLASVVGGANAGAGLSLPVSSVQSTLSADASLLSALLSSLTQSLLGILSPTSPSVAPPPTSVPPAAPQQGSNAPVPMAPVSVSVEQGGTLPDLVVDWVPATGGNLATGAAVQLSQVVNGASDFVTQITCGACTTSTFRGLTFGDTYEAAVFPTDAGGIGPSLMSTEVNLSTTCPDGACVTFDATQSLGDATHAAAGILNSVYPEGNDAADLAALGTTMYRSAPNASGSNFNWSNWDVATTAGAQTTVVLSDLWADANGGSPPTPWSEWGTYTSWVKTTVLALLATGQRINYWEVYNEPGGDSGYYSASGYASETTALLLQQFLVTYQAIKAVDPGAAVIGPSLAQWSDYPSQYSTSSHQFDMVTFLNFAAANNIQLAALSWHEILNNYGPIAEENTLYPAILEDHVAEARALIAARPSLGDPQIFIDEYGMPEVQKNPGWDVGYLAALTDAGVNSADRSCWDGDCNSPDLDGLLSSDGSGVLPDYYERLMYQSMAGDMVPTTSTADTVSALGSYNSATEAFVGLIGRGVGCSQDVSDCPSSWPDSKRAAPTSVLVTITVPWISGTATVALTDVSGQLPELPLVAPMPMDTTATIVPSGQDTGTITFTIPEFADGDAYGISITN